jgi:hypothetical protein
MASLLGPLIRLGAIGGAFAAGGALVWATLQVSPPSSGDASGANERDQAGSPQAQRAAPLVSLSQAEARAEEDALVQPKFAQTAELGAVAPRAAAPAGPLDEVVDRVMRENVVGGARSDWPTEVSAPNHSQPLQFVVAADNATLNAIGEQFLQSPVAARAAFAAYAAEQPFFNDLELLTMNVNGEFILIYAGSLPEGPREKAMLARALANRLNAHPDVRYAEPNYRTKIGEGDKVE